MTRPHPGRAPRNFPRGPSPDSISRASNSPSPRGDRSPSDRRTCASRTRHECRINAEDWARDFRPSPGTVTEAVWPLGDGIRIDTHLQAGASVPPYYDSLLAN
ncbi:hypothetical protein QBA38_42415 [Streptomyces stelliscabiei]